MNIHSVQPAASAERVSTRVRRSTADTAQEIAAARAAERARLAERVRAEARRLADERAVAQARAAEQVRHARALVRSSWIRRVAAATGAVVAAMMMLVGCAATSEPPSAIESRLAAGADFAIAPGVLDVTVLKGDATTGLVPQIEGGRLVIDSDMNIGFELVLADFEVSAELSGLETPLTFVDVSVAMPPAAATTTWHDDGVHAALYQPLQLDWSLASPRGPAPLAQQIVRAEIAVDIRLDANGLHASLFAERQGAVWHFGELSLRDLTIDVRAQ